MGYNERDIFVGKDVNGNEICAGFRLQMNVAQGTSLTEAILSLWPLRLYPAGTPFWDRFEGDNVPLEEHTAILHSSLPWVKRIGQGSINNGNRVRITGTAGVNIYTIDPGEADGIVYTYAYLDGSGHIGLVFRFADLDNYWYLMGNYSNNDLYLYKVVDGNHTKLDQVNADDPNNWRHYEVVLNGDSIKCYFDDDLKIDVTDSDLQSNTQHGLYANLNSKYDDAYYDRFEFVPSGTPTIDLEAACDDVDDAPDFDEGDLPGDRTLTTAKTSLGDISDWIAGQWNETVDIKSPLQEVLDRLGWAADQYLAVILKPASGCANGELLRLAGYEEDSAHAATLDVQW
jgi:hypothetical protein